MSDVPEKSLYTRLGGYDAIAAAVDDLLPRLTSDPQIGVYRRGHSTDSMHREPQMAVDFLCAALGGPVLYRGRDMKTAHAGLCISESEWSGSPLCSRPSRPPSSPYHLRPQPAGQSDYPIRSGSP